MNWRGIFVAKAKGLVGGKMMILNRSGSIPTISTNGEVLQQSNGGQQEGDLMYSCSSVLSDQWFDLRDCVAANKVRFGVS